MKREKLVFRLFVCLAVCVVFASACKRRPQNYAGLPDPNKGEVVDPHKSY
jgi:hypothetical protein